MVISQRRLMFSLIFGMICLVGGSALSAKSQHKYDGAYSGKRSLTKGTASATCPAEDDVSVTIPGLRSLLLAQRGESVEWPDDNGFRVNWLNKPTRTVSDTRVPGSSSV